MNLFRLCTSTLLLLGTLSLFSQKKNANFEYHIHRADSPLKIDGSGDDPAWSKAEMVSDFYMVLPMDTSKAKVRTEVRMLYDDQNMYLLAVCYEKLDGPYMVESLRRDFNFGRNDNFLLFMDPFDDLTNGFTFGSNAEGAQWDGLLFEGGSANLSWDNKWTSEVKAEEDKWTFEMAVPFKTLRYKSGITRWGINFSRLDLKTTEKSSWTPVPRQFPTASLAYTGTLVWDEPPPPAGANFSVIPYALANTSKDYTKSGPGKTTGDVGVDAKIAITSALNLDLTVNPDFSQVEVDRQQTNLDRFELFFPERRQFFIENSDLFASNGFSKIRPFFSRQIGLAGGQAVPILGGARLSGKLTPNWRIGLMDMQTEGIGSLGLRPQNFAVAAVQRQLFARSNISAIFVNRQGFSGNTPDGQDYNRTAGLDFNFATADNRWRGKAFYHHTFDPLSSDRKGAQAVWLSYATQRWDLQYNHEWVQKNYNAEVGFVPRLGYFRFEHIAKRNFYPKRQGAILRHGPEAYMSWYWDNVSWQSIERHSRVGYSLSFRSRAELALRASEWYVFLENRFDPSQSGLAPLPDSVGYRWRNLEATYTTDFRKPLSLTATSNYGSYYQGDKLTNSAELTYRRQPWGIFSLAFEHNHITLADTVVDLLLISPRFELSFTRSLFFTTFFQYNTQTENFNINARLQWRFAPMSDLFIVLTDNYFTETMAVRNRSVVLKLNYWFTL